MDAARTRPLGRLEANASVMVWQARYACPDQFGGDEVRQKQNSCT
jgi:hypothetical protein